MNWTQRLYRFFSVKGKTKNKLSSESPDSTAPYLIVGLGNPGEKYKNTRHNVGFDCLNLLHRQIGSPMLTSKFEGQFHKTQIRDRVTILSWPLTFMNLSGNCVKRIAKYYKIPAKQILVVCDDLALPLGRLRMKSKGSSGGQNGLNHILNLLETREVSRLRIGIDPVPDRWDTKNYVLSKFGADERVIVDKSIEQAAAACRDWIERGIDYCMNKYNADPAKPKQVKPDTRTRQTNQSTSSKSQNLDSSGESQSGETGAGNF